MIITSFTKLGGKRTFCFGSLVLGILSLFFWFYIFDVHYEYGIATSVRGNEVVIKRKLSVFRKQFLKRDLLRFCKSLEKPVDEKEHSLLNISEKSKERIPTSFPRKVLIISGGRSGSTFLGNLFNENRGKALYLFEPLHDFTADPDDDATTLKVLRQLYDCNTVNNNYVTDLLLKNKYFRRKGSLFDFPVRCKRTIFKKRCLARLLKSLCRRASSIVTKVLTHRLPEHSIRAIKEVMEVHRSLKIIHLIRDPRRVVPSMKEVGWFEGRNFTEDVQELCTSIWQNIVYVRENAAYFKDRYKLVVFTEMIKRPFSTVVSLYDFVNMAPVPEDVFSWIVTNTQGSLRKKRHSWGAYSTYRNSTEVLNKKVDLTKEESMVINRYCSSLIDFIENYNKLHP